MTAKQSEHLDAAIRALRRSENAGVNALELRELREAVRELVYAIEAKR